jgi:hypothetical protein
MPTIGTPTYPTPSRGLTVEQVLASDPGAFSRPSRGAYAQNLDASSKDAVDRINTHHGATGPHPLPRELWPDAR